MEKLYIDTFKANGAILNDVKDQEAKNANDINIDNINNNKFLVLFTGDIQGNLIIWKVSNNKKYERLFYINSLVDSCLSNICWLNNNNYCLVSNITGIINMLNFNDVFEIDNTVLPLDNYTNFEETKNFVNQTLCYSNNVNSIGVSTNALNNNVNRNNINFNNLIANAKSSDVNDNKNRYINNNNKSAKRKITPTLISTDVNYNNTTVIKNNNNNSNSNNNDILNKSHINNNNNNNNNTNNNINLFNNAINSNILLNSNNKLNNFTSNININSNLSCGINNFFRLNLDKFINIYNNYSFYIEFKNEEYLNNNIRKYNCLIECYFDNKQLYTYNLSLNIIKYTYNNSYFVYYDSNNNVTCKTIFNTLVYSYISTPNIKMLKLVNNNYLVIIDENNDVNVKDLLITSHKQSQNNTSISNLRLNLLNNEIINDVKIISNNNVLLINLINKDSNTQKWFALNIASVSAPNISNCNLNTSINNVNNSFNFYESSFCDNDIQVIESHNLDNILFKDNLNSNYNKNKNLYHNILSNSYFSQFIISNYNEFNRNEFNIWNSINESQNKYLSFSNTADIQLLKNNLNLLNLKNNIFTSLYDSLMKTPLLVIDYLGLYAYYNIFEFEANYIVNVINKDVLDIIKKIINI